MVGITGGVRTPEAPFFSLDSQLKKAKFEDALEILLNVGQFAIFFFRIVFFFLVHVR